MIKSGFYTIPASQAFADNLVTGIIDKFPEPEQLARIELYLPSRRAISSIKEVFLQHQNQGPILLPKMFAVGEPDEEVALNKRADNPSRLNRYSAHDKSLYESNFAITNGGCNFPGYRAGY